MLPEQAAVKAEEWLNRALDRRRSQYVADWLRETNAQDRETLWLEARVLNDLVASLKAEIFNAKKET